MDGSSQYGQVKGVLPGALFFSCTPAEFFSLQFHILGATYSTFALMLACGFITPVTAIEYSGRDSSPQRARKTRAVQWDPGSWGKAVVRGKISLIL